MSSPKLITNPPQGSGLVPALVDRHYEDLVRGLPGELVACVALLQPVGISQRRTKDGLHRTVTYEAVRLEPVRESSEADQIAWEVSRHYEARTSGGSQQVLPLAAGPAQQRLGLLESIEEWRGEHDVAVVDLDERWLNYFGGSEHAASATVKAGSLLQLMEFSRYIGAVEDAGPDDGQDDEP